MPRDNLVVGLDIGSSKIAVCVGTISDGATQITGLTSVPHTGLRKGVIVDLEETVSMISHALEEAERMAGAAINHVLVSIGGSHIASQNAKGVVAVSKPSGEIGPDDVERVMEAAKTVALPQNRELIHVFPKHFIVDGIEEIRDPVGMTGVRLEVEALIISGATAALRNLMRVVEQAGMQVDDLVFSPLSATKIVTTKKQRESGVAVADFGAGSTGLAIYEDGQLLHAVNLPIGSTHITNDIAIGLRTNLDLAEMIKTKYGSCLPDRIRESETINLSLLDPAEDEKISRRQVAEIIEARLSEVCQLIKEELEGLGRDGLLPAGIIFTGGGSELEGLTEIARAALRLPASVGFPTANFSGLVDKLDNPVYATSIGLVLWGMDQTDRTAPWRFDLGKFGGVVDRFRGIFRPFTN